MVIVILLAIVLLAFALNSKKKPMLTGSDDTHASTDGKPRLGCLQVVQRLGLFVAACIAVVVIYYSLQPKNVGYDDLLTADNANTYVDHHTWSDSGFEYGNTEAAERAISHLGDKAYGRKFGDLMDWEKHRHQVATEAAERAKDTVRTKDATGCDTTKVTFSQGGGVIECKGTVKEEQQDRQQLIKHDYAQLASLARIDRDVVDAMNTPGTDLSDIYADFDTCSQKASEFMVTLPSSLPDYIPAHNDSSAVDDAPNDAALAMKHYCEAGKTYVNDETPQHGAALKEASDAAALSLFVDYELYLGAYLKAGGSKANFPPSQPGHLSESSGGSQQAVIATPTSVNSGDSAQNTVVTFYNAITARRYLTAYNLLDGQYRAATPYDQFVAGYKTTQEVVAEVGPWNSSNGAVATELEATDLKAGSVIHSHFSGYWHVKREGDDWRLYDGELHSVAAAASGSTGTAMPLQDNTSAGTDATHATESGRRFSQASCGAVSDSKTGLMWLLGPNENMGWDAAVAFAESADACGRKWRLPTIRELATLYDPQLTAGTGYYSQGQHYPAHIATVFSAIGDGSWGWSSEAVDNDTARAYNFNQGVATQYAKSNVTFSTRAFAVAASP